ncbi:CdaR family transcriptional regulator [Alkalicoccus luteus]|uniref:CdaR family transcriptional regulator n=1 Tax=Alkalicoccus luteus TaxID=1237094 RepID=UPI00403489CF
MNDLVISDDLAARIVAEASDVIEEEIIVIDKDGYITAATDSGRIGTRHLPGREVMITGKAKTVSESEAQTDPSVRAGTVLPLGFRGSIIGVLGITGSREKTATYGALLQKMTELLIEKLFSAEALRLRWYAGERLLHGLLAAKENSEEQKRIASRIGLNDDDFYSVLIVQMVQPEPEEIPYPEQFAGFLTKWRYDQYVCIWASDQAEQLSSQFMNYLDKHDAVVERAGLSRPGMDFANMLEEAETAAQHSSGELIIYQMLSLELLLHDLTDRTKKKLMEDTALSNDTALRRTVEAFIQEGYSLKRTAAVLDVHVNTVQYRLAKLEDLTGLSWKRGEDLAVLVIAVKLLNQPKKQ